MILDKTGTLTYGRPALADEIYAARDSIVRSCCRWSRRSSATAGIRWRRRLSRRPPRPRYPLPDVEWIREEAGTGLHGQVGGKRVLITSHAKAAERFTIPAERADRSRVRRSSSTIGTRRRSAFATCRAKTAGASSRTSARGTGLRACCWCPAIARAKSGGWRSRWRSPRFTPSTSPEGKLAIVRRETARARTVFIGDGINDAPALMAATVGIAFGQHSDVTSEAARVGHHRLVVVESRRADSSELSPASHRAAERGRRDAAQRRRDGVRRWRLADAGRGRRRSGGHRSAGGAQRAPDGLRKPG